MRGETGLLGGGAPGELFSGPRGGSEKKGRAGGAGGGGGVQIGVPREGQKMVTPEL